MDDETLWVAEGPDVPLARRLVVEMGGVPMRREWFDPDGSASTAERNAIDFVIPRPSHRRAFRVQAWRLAPGQPVCVPPEERDTERERTRPFSPPEEVAVVDIAILFDAGARFAILADAWLVREAEVHPGDYARQLPISAIKEAGWHCWNADHGDEMGPVMTLIGLRPDWLPAVPEFEALASGLPTPYRTPYAEKAGDAFRRRNGGHP